MNVVNRTRWLYSTDRIVQLFLEYFLFVGVIYSKEELTRREQISGDRKIGLANSLFDRVYSFNEYDLEVNTEELSPTKCAEKVLSSSVCPTNVGITLKGDYNSTHHGAVLPAAAAPFFVKRSLNHLVFGGIEMNSEPINDDVLISILMDDYAILVTQCTFSGHNFHDNYVIQTNEGKAYFIRVYRNGIRNQNEILFELEFINFLKK